MSSAPTTIFSSENGIDSELVGEFLWVARDELAALEQGLVACEKTGATRDAISSLYRTMHSLKGSAGLVRLRVLEQAGHAGEALLSPLRDDPTRLTPDMVSALLSFIDAAKANLTVIEQEQREDPNVFAAFLGLIAEASAGMVPVALSQPAARKVAPSPARVIDVAPVETAPVAAVLAPVATPPPARSARISEPPRVTDPPPAAEAADTAVRVDLGLLDHIMNLVGELVLARNQMLQAAAKYDDPALTTSGQAIDDVTTLLQSHIMRTRMQPIGMVFAKFPRAVRDLARQLDKKIELELIGKDTELDRTILDAMRDPFTHILRNSCDHGVERPAERLAAGKPEFGTIRVRAFHEGGQVVVEVSDDGKGIDPATVKAKAISMGLIQTAQAARMTDSEALLLICHPGLSTAEQVTAISGRGVGMDVVRTHIEKVGGSIEIHSVVGKGSTVRIKIPLTLAIIPALMVACGDRLYGIPQVNLVELVGVEYSTLGQGLEAVRGAEVYRLRERLLTIIRLEDVLGTPRRERTHDEMIFIVVVAAGDQQFGVVVDDISDTEEIVVKPLSRHLAGLGWYAGATIRGDGGVALILDVPGMARKVGITATESGSTAHANSMTDERSEFLVFTLGNREQFAVPLASVARIDQCRLRELTTVNGTRVICRDGKLVPAIEIERITKAEPGPTVDPDTPMYAIMLKEANAAIVARQLIDNLTIETSTILSDPSVLGTAAITGLAVVAGQPTALLDPHALVSRAFPRQSAAPITPAPVASSTVAGAVLTAAAALEVLYCEDAQFFQNVVAGYLRDAGYVVTVCPDGRAGVAAFEAAPTRWALILTDLEMPVMDGWELIKHVRANPGHDRVPIMALTSLSDESARQRTLQCGANRYAVKIDRDALIAAVSDLIRVHNPGATP